jgi:maltose alpha-D-glucosyltransferase / alpha-amylase
MPDDALMTNDAPVPTADALWYKDAIIYQLHVKAFFDENDDGVGDFRGLTAKLDYLRDLGVTALWLLPFYLSPLRDDGYDIADYRNINPAYGTMQDFRNFVREAHRRDLRVITELVINHTSDQHVWFQRARQAPRGSRLRDFYVWSDSDQKFADTRVIFLDTEKSNWAWDPVAQAYYWHRFYSHQPDLNFDNPRVFRSIVNVMKFWLDLGVDGMRLDAVPYLIEREGTNNENLPETHAILKRLRAELDRTYGDRMLLAEANQWPEDVRHYFGEGDECHMAFHFPLMPRLFMAVASEDRHPITDIMRQTPEIPDNCQWAIFLRNHDELTLEMVTDRERDYLWDFYAADRRMRLNLGIRRRLTPLMENDRRKIELLNSVMLSMPGTPVMYYGDEIGMGDNVFLGDRDGVRTPMQWGPDRNGGFSRSDPARLYLPPIMDAVYGYQSVNVEAQIRSPSSLLNWMKRLIAVRRVHRAFGRGDLKFLYPKNRKVFAYLRSYEDETILCVVNLSHSPQPVELDLSEYKGRIPLELIGRSAFPRVGDLPYLLTLQAYGFFWFILKQPSQSEIEPPLVLPPEFVTLVLPQGWTDLLDRHNRPQLESDILPLFLVTRRWFAAKNRRIRRTTVVERAEIAGERDRWLILVVDVEFADGSKQRYHLPLAAVWDTDPGDAGLLAFKLAETRRFRRNGAIVDAMMRPDFVLDTVRAIGANEVHAADTGEIRFRRAAAFDKAVLPGTPSVRPIGAEQSNSSALIDDYAVLKIYRQLQPGINPEIEIGEYLTEHTDFANTPALLGTIELVEPSPDGGEPARTTLGLLAEFVRDQGDAWTQALDYLDRTLHHATIGEGAEVEATVQPDLFFFTLARQLGLRTAQLHRALCPASDDDPRFAPEPVTPADLASWRESAHQLANRVLASLAQSRDLAADAQELATALLAAQELLANRIDALPSQMTAVKTRFHGDYHLGQVLVVKNDFFIIDFEGEPMRPIAERRAKNSPMRDVGGMLRSFSYAAATALRRMGEIPPAQRATLHDSAVRWLAIASESFMNGYLEAMTDCPSLPADPAEARQLIAFFTLEKALREIEYELANRPDWVAIPLRAVVELLTPPEAVVDGDEVA